MATHAPVPAKKRVLLVVPNMSKRNLRASVLRKRGMRSRTELAGAFGDGGGSRAR